MTVTPCIVVGDLALAQHHPCPETGFGIVVQVVVAYNTIFVLGRWTACLDEDTIATRLAATACTLVVVDIIACDRKPGLIFSTIYPACMDAMSYYVPGIEPVVMYFAVIYGVIANLVSL